MADEPTQHGRRTGDIERRRWTDDRLDDLQELVRAFGPTVTMAAGHDAILREHTSDLADFKQWLADLDQRLTRRIDEEANAQAEFRREYRKHREEDQRAERKRAEQEAARQAKARKDRGVLIVSLVVAFVPVLVALIYAAANLLSHGATGVPTP
jgi:hypothetical protein